MPLFRTGFFIFIGLLFAMAHILPVKTVFAQQKQDFSKLPARKSQEWVHNGVIYEIFPRAFSPEGNFNGVTSRLDDLKSLGVTILWLMPIHPISKEKRKGTFGSPYAISDYYAVNPDYGSKEDFKRLVSEAHKRGFKVIIDIVANHTGWDSVMLKNPEFYTHDANGKIIPPIAEWTDVADLNYENPKLRAYMVDMLKYWLREFDLDGFRCDVAGFVPTDFWEQARTELESVKPDIFMLAEWHEPDLMVKAFDADYAWALLHTLEDVFMKGATAAELKKTWLEERARFPQGTLHMRMSDNHDELRAVAKFSAEGARAASAMMFTLDGVPLLYNGMEIGDTAESGAPALFEKLPVVWQTQERRPNVLPFYKELVALRRQHRALQSGATEWLSNSEETRIVSYVRRDAKEEFLVVVNCSNRPFVGAVEVAQGNAFRDVTPGAGPSKRPVALPTISLESWGFRIFHREVKGA